MTKAIYNTKLLKALLSESPEVLSERLRAETIIMTNEERYPDKTTTQKKLLAFKPSLASIKEEDESSIAKEDESLSDQTIDSQASSALTEPLLDQTKNAPNVVYADLAIKAPLLASDLLKLLDHGGDQTVSTVTPYGLEDAEENPDYLAKYPEFDMTIATRKTGVTAGPTDSF